MNKYTQIGHALAEYSFLTYNQMITLGLATHRSNLSPYIQELIANKLIYKLHKIGHQAIFYLSPKGGRYFSGIGRKQYKKYPVDTQHKMDTVDFHIYLKNHYLVMVSRYFDKGNACQIRLINRSLEPDLLAILETPKQSELLLFEAERGNDIGKIEKKVLLHFSCIMQRGVSRTFQFDRAYRIVIKVDSQEIFNRVKKRLLDRDELKSYHENFLFFWERDDFYNMRGVSRKLYYV